MNSQLPKPALIDLADMPRTKNGRISWLAFYADMKVGDSRLLAGCLYPGMHKMATNYGMKIRMRSHANGNFTLTVLEAPAEPRPMMLAALSSLSDKRLVALYQAGVKAGIFLRAAV